MERPVFQPAPLPADEVGRLRALRELDILDSAPEQVFDDLTALAAQLAGTPVALVSLVDAQRQWFKSRQGFELRETPRDWSFCAHALLGDEVMVVPDATQDPRFAGNPLVLGSPPVGFYAGVPLRTPDGFALGTLCVLDHRPRQLEPAQRDALTRLGRLVERAIETRHAALRLQRAQQRLGRLADFRALLAEVSQASASADDELTLLQQACELGVRYGGARLMYAARPDAQGRLEFIASAGSSEYLREIVISVHEHEPQGRGFVGRAWREARAFFCDDFAGTPELHPWRDAAQRFGLRAAATLPLLRDGQVWAVTTLLDARHGVYDNDLREVLRELGHELSRGLDRIALARRERGSAAMRDLLLDHSQAGIACIRDGVLVRVNPRLIRMLGYGDAAELLAQRPLDLLADPDEYRRWQEIDASLGEQPLLGASLRLRRRDGSLVHCDVSAGVVEESPGRTVVWTVLDIGERLQLQSRLERALAYQRDLLEKNAAGMFTLGADSVIRDVNPALCSMLGHARESLTGQPMAWLLLDPAQAEHFSLAAARGAQRARHVQLRHREGAARVCQVSGAPIELPDGSAGTLWSVIDVTALHQARETVAHQARHDALTDLPNRRALEQYLPRALARRRRGGGVLALGMLDLDDFKPVNDAFGHAAGDLLLREFASRLRQAMREGDFLARFGGDEFVLVLEDLDEHAWEAQIEAVMQRLHQAVAQEFELSRGRRARVGMSVGLALLPLHGASAEQLLRQADLALYQVKAKKAQRARWWQVGAGAEHGAEESAGFDAHDPASHEALRLAPLAAALAPQSYMQRLLGEWGAEAHGLREPVVAELVQDEAQHLTWLLQPELGIERLRERAGARGRDLALMGVPAAMLTHASGLLRDELAARLRGSPLMARSRHTLMQIADARLQSDLQARMQGYERTVASYFQVFDAPLPRPGSLWRDALARLLQPLAELDGMLACMVLRPDSQGCFQIEAAAGPRCDALADDLRQQRYQLLQDDDKPAGGGLVGLAWRSGQVHSTPEYGDDPRLRLWHEPMRGHGVRSLVAVPVPAQQQGADFVLALFGAWPGQFETLRMRRFAHAVQQRAGQFWSACKAPRPSQVQPLEVAQAWRSALFRGGLELHMQPVIDLVDGTVQRVEALARLRDADGRVVSPAAFLPLLGDVELDRLLRLVLEQALQWLRRWDGDGRQLQVSVNLPPTTLLHPQCADWVAQALHASGIDPRRLTLELLETHEFDSTAQARAIGALAELGVKLAMDDLGSGYSSLKRLTELPFDIIKVDQSLTLNLRRSPMLSLSLISTLIKMGRDLGRQVIVEGVQDDDTVAAVFALGATLVQGYALARPMPGADFAAWCASRRPLPHARRVDGPLSALAVHWALAHAGGTPDGAAAACPVADWLRRCGLEHSEAARWHAALHEQPAAWSTEHAFVQWLLARIAG